jgi:NADPH-dependent ferric siderophore reductase
MGQLSAETRIENDVIRLVMEKLRAEHRDYEVDTGVEGQWEFHMHYGSVSTFLEERSVFIRVYAEDETCLSYMKMTVAGHVSEYLGSTEGIRWQGDGIDAGTPVFFREVRVVSSTRVSPHMQRVRFSAGDLGRFAHGGLHVRLLLPPKGRQPVWPSMGADGLIVWPTGADALILRVYTIRAIDVAGGWFDVDFVLHPGSHTPAATFAQTARPGDVIGMIGPGGGDVPDAPNLLLLGDDTALPAIGRILDQIPSTTEVDVFVEVDGPADATPLAGGGNIRVTWLYRYGREPGTANLLSDTLRKIDPASLAPDVHVWAGCEFSDFRELRKIVRKEWGLKKDRQLIVAYWRRGVQGEDGSGGSEE